MKKIFTLISVALCAMSVNAAEQEPGFYPVKSVVWKSITWKNGNNKKDKDNNDMLFLMGTGNGYATLLAEYYYSEDKKDYFTRPAYSYINYEAGETGIPAYGLYYKFTPKTSGTLKFKTWVNKGNRKTFVVKASTGMPLEPYVDYTFDGYVNGQNTNTDQPKIDPETGEQQLDNEGNPVWIQVPTYFTAEQIKARVDDENATRAAKGDAPINKYVIEKGNQAVWGWITLNVEAGESYVIYQQSSQLGFGGFTFGSDEYVSCLDMGGTIVLNEDFSKIIDENGNATNVDNRGSVVNFSTANMDVEAVGGAEPESVEADFDATGIVKVNAETLDAKGPMHNLAGQKVGKNFKGIVLLNGKKMIMK